MLPYPPDSNETHHHGLQVRHIKHNISDTIDTIDCRGNLSKFDYAGRHVFDSRCSRTLNPCLRHLGWRAGKPFLAVCGSEPCTRRNGCNNVTTHRHQIERLGHRLNDSDCFEMVVLQNGRHLETAVCGIQVKYHVILMNCNWPATFK